MKIQVTNDNTYNGRKEEWLEEKTNEIVLAEDLFCVHKSHNKVEAFEAGIVTCCYDEFVSPGLINITTRESARKALKVLEDLTHVAKPSNPAEWVYLFKIPAGTFVKEYGNEYRFEMCDKVEIELLGTCGRMQVIDDSFTSRSMGYNYINVWTEQF